MTKYNSSFKQQVIAFYLQNGKNRSLTRQHFQTEEERLRYRILELEAENAILKKLQALNQEKMRKLSRKLQRFFTKIMEIMVIVVLRWCCVGYGQSTTKSPSDYAKIGDGVQMYGRYPHQRFI